MTCSHTSTNDADSCFGGDAVLLFRAAAQDGVLVPGACVQQLSEDELRHTCDMTQPAKQGCITSLTDLKRHKLLACLHRNAVHAL